MIHILGHVKELVEQRQIDYVYVSGNCQNKNQGSLKLDWTGHYSKG